MNTSRLSDVYLRDWQQKSLVGFLDRYDKKQVEFTVAHQGSGKTLYTAACYLFSLLGKNFQDYRTAKISKIKAIFNSPLNHIKATRQDNFVVVFVPNKAIIQNTIRDWGELGIVLDTMDNLELKTEDLKYKNVLGLDGIVVTYQQASNNGYKNDGYWLNNHLIRFLQSDTSVNIHTVFDECHNMTVRKIGCLVNPVKETATLGAKFLLANHPIFKKIHLVTGTPAKKSSRYFGRTLYPVIPLAKYNENHLLVPDTLYSKDDAINDNNIVKTNILIHHLEKVDIKLGDKELTIEDADLTWFAENVNETAMKNSWHKNHKKLKDIQSAIDAIYNDLGLWKQLLEYGNQWLTKTRLKHPQSIGIIFCPNREVAIKVHKELLFTDSVLCLGSQDKIPGTVLVSSGKIADFLNTRKSNIKWIVSCEALKEGFDYPDCKVNILIPRLSFLSLTKISQMLGRTNRIIPKIPNLDAYSITLNYKPVIELIKNDVSGKYGLLEPELANQDALDSHTNQVVEKAKERSQSNVGYREEKRIDPVVIESLLLSSDAEILGLNKSDTFHYDEETRKKLQEMDIRSRWLHWVDVVWENADIWHRLPPDNVSGVYLMLNAKTLEYLYVGSSHDLYSRIKNRKRFDSTKWVITEGYQNIFVRWVVCEDYVRQEAELKLLVNPKYDDENPPNLRLV